MILSPMLITLLAMAVADACRALVTMVVPKRAEPPCRDDSIARCRPHLRVLADVRRSERAQLLPRWT